MSETFDAAEALERLRARVFGEPGERSEWVAFRSPEGASAHYMLRDETYTIPDAALLDLQRYVLNGMERSILFGDESDTREAPRLTDEGAAEVDPLAPGTHVRHVNTGSTGRVIEPFDATHVRINWDNFEGTDEESDGRAARRNLEVIPEQSPDATSRDLPDATRMDERSTNAGGRARVTSRETRYGCNCEECAPRDERQGARRCAHDVVGAVCERCTEDRAAGIMLPDDPREVAERERERAERPPRYRAWLSVPCPVAIEDLRAIRRALGNTDLTNTPLQTHGGWRLLEIGENEHGFWYMFGTERRPSCWTEAHRRAHEAHPHLTRLHTEYFDLVVGTTGDLRSGDARALRGALNAVFSEQYMSLHDSWNREIVEGTGDDEGWEGATERIVHLVTANRERGTTLAETIATAQASSAVETGALGDILAEAMTTFSVEEPEREWAFQEDEDEHESEEGALAYAT